MTALATPANFDAQLQALQAAAPRWIALPVAAKADLFRRVRQSVYHEAEAWASAAADAKGLTATPLEGEEWLSGPWALLYALNRYIASLDQIATFGVPQIARSRRRTRPDGQLVVDVFPNDLYDRTLLSGVRAEVWMQPGVTAGNLDESMAVWYRKSALHQPRVALVLGAGNIASIPPLDVLYKLIADGAVCILKMNPVNGYLGPILERAMAPLIAADYLRIVQGDANAGKTLCEHQLIDEIHITGSDKTHDVIVFGAGPDGADRKGRNDPVLRKPITSELGNVSPTIVVPGPWNDADFRFQAEQIVTQKLHNDGFNCVASQVLIVPRNWRGTARLLAEIDSVLQNVADRPAYYPGAEQRYQDLTAGREHVVRYGRAGDGFTSRTLIDADATTDDRAFQIEAFASVLAVTQIPGDTADYLRDAVTFANTRLWGTLGANIVAHPRTMGEFYRDIDSAIATLRYGCIAVNAWTGVGFLVTDATWGAFPGHTIDDVGSGVGVVHNAYLFDKAQKSVVYAPFAPFPRSLAGYGATLLPRPPWFVTNRMAAKTARALVDYEYRKNPLTLTKVAALAMRG
jgi:aldehyde dehydrogenase (NAD(P)+)